MKICLHVLILIAGLTRQLALGTTLDVEVSSLIAHTPLSQPGWQINTSKNDHLGLSQVWFSHEEGEALLVLPRANTVLEMTTPWGEVIYPEANQAQLHISTQSSQTWHIDRFGGMITAVGKRLEISFKVQAANGLKANYFDLMSAGKLIIGGQHHAVIKVDGTIKEIVGRGSKLDELYGPDEHNTWLIRAGGEGTLQARSWGHSLSFKGIDTLIGSDHDDQFVLVDGVLNATIEGAGGHNEILFSAPRKQAALGSPSSCQDCSENDLRITIATPSISELASSSIIQPKVVTVETESIKTTPVGTPVPTGLMGIAAVFGLLASFVGQAPVLLTLVR